MARTRKVKLAIFDNDLKATVKKYEVSKDGTKISVLSGGEGHFMPIFDNDSFIDLPKPWYKGRGWDRIYFVKKKGKKCVNFKTSEVFNPDPEQLKSAIGATLLGELGKDKTETPLIWYIILLILLGIAGKVFGVLV